MDQFLNFTITHLFEGIGTLPFTDYYSGAVLLLAGVLAFRKITRV